MKLKFAFLAVVLSYFSHAQMLSSFEEVEKLRKENPKPVVVLFTTEWCGVCRVQKKNLSKLPQSTWDSVYFISINPEKYHKDIEFFGKKYTFVSNGTSGLHKIAYELAGGRVPAYPFWVFADENGKMLTHEGLLKEKELNSIFSNHNH